MEFTKINTAKSIANPQGLRLGSSPNFSRLHINEQLPLSIDRTTLSSDSLHRVPTTISMAQTINSRVSQKMLDQGNSILELIKYTINKKNLDMEGYNRLLQSLIDSDSPGPIVNGMKLLENEVKSLRVIEKDRLSTFNKILNNIENLGIVNNVIVLPDLVAAAREMRSTIMHRKQHLDNSTANKIKGYIKTISPSEKKKRSKMKALTEVDKKSMKEAFNVQQDDSRESVAPRSSEDADEITEKSKENIKELVMRLTGRREHRIDQSAESDHENFENNLRFHDIQRISYRIARNLKKTTWSSKEASFCFDMLERLASSDNRAFSEAFLKKIPYSLGKKSLSISTWKGRIDILTNLMDKYPSEIIHIKARDLLEAYAYDEELHKDVFYENMINYKEALYLHMKENSASDNIPFLKEIYNKAETKHMGMQLKYGELNLQLPKP